MCARHFSANAGGVMCAKHFSVQVLLVAVVCAKDFSV